MAILCDVVFLLYKNCISAVKNDAGVLLQVCKTPISIPYQYLNTELTICYAARCVTLWPVINPMWFFGGVGRGSQYKTWGLCISIAILAPTSSMFIANLHFVVNYAPRHISQGAIFMATSELPWKCYEHMAYTKEIIMAASPMIQKCCLLFAVQKLHIIFCTAKSVQNRRITPYQGRHLSLFYAQFMAFLWQCSPVVLMWIFSRVFCTILCTFLCH